MKKNLISTLLIDDDSDINYFHERAIKKFDPDIEVVIKNSGMAALEFLKSKSKSNDHNAPDLIFLDINMPGMNGWEFLEKYNLLNKGFQNRPILIMLTTSENPEDQVKAKSFNYVSDYITKPLTKELFGVITNKYFE